MVVAKHVGIKITLEVKRTEVIIVCHSEFGRVINKKLIYFKDPNGFVDGINNLLSITDKYKAKVTFAVCPEVASYFPIKTDCEIGLHLHPGWREFKIDGYRYYVGDEYLRTNCKQSTNSTVLRDYSFAEQYLMIKEGIEHLIKTIGLVPTCFVAGRWSINNDTVKALIRDGLLRDCSAMAHHRLGHFDWSKLSRICMPYHPSEHDYQVKGDLPLLIIPISQMSRGGNVNPETARIYPLSWLKLCFTEYYLKKKPLFHICLHSPAMQDKYYINILDKLLGFIVNYENIKFKYVSEITEYGN